MLPARGVLLMLLATAWLTPRAAFTQEEVFFYSDSLPGGVELKEDEGWNRALWVGQSLKEGGDPTEQTVFIRKEINESSPQLALFAASSQTLPKLEIIVFVPDNPATPILRLILNEVRVHQKKLNSAPGKNLCEEWIAFRFQSIQWNYHHFFMWGDEEGLEHTAFWDYAKQQGDFKSPAAGSIPAGAFKLFREGLRVERISELDDSLELTWPALDGATYDIFSSSDLTEEFTTHVKTVNSAEDGFVSAFVEKPDEYDRMFFIVRLRMEE